MNSRPNTSGIDRKWEPGFDDRVRLLPRCKGVGRKELENVLTALSEMLAENRRVRFVGFGVFEWKPWNKRIPTGKSVKAWHLSFKPSRYTTRYKGD